MLTVNVTGLDWEAEPILKRALWSVVTSTDFFSETFDIPAGFLLSLELKSNSVKLWCQSSVKLKYDFVELTSNPVQFNAKSEN